MPVDADGNRAELIVDGQSTIKRMNVARVIEQYINACSRDVTKRIQQMYHTRCTYEQIEAYLLDYYRTVSPRMVDLVVDEQGRLKESHLQQVLTDGIYLWIPTDNEPETMDIIKELSERFPPTFGPVSYRGESGVKKWTRNNILIGSMYILLLEKTGRDWAAVSTSKLNHFGIPSKLTDIDRNANPSRPQPIRFGESEARLFAAFVGGEETAHLIDRSNNPVVRKQAIDSILRAKEPTNIESAVDRRQYPIGNGRIVSLVHHFSECAGWRFKQGYMENSDE